jgi:Na+-transporting NADH:ubiquinone oxidoreductase subunit E
MAIGFMSFGGMLTGGDEEATEELTTATTPVVSEVENTQEVAVILESENEADNKIEIVE